MKGPRKLIADRFEILSILGEGNIGVVYKCYDPVLDHLVAVKVLQDSGDHNASRFQLEAKATAKLDHPNIVKIIDFGEAKGDLYLVLEYCSGRSLAEQIKSEGALNTEYAVQIFRSILKALAYAENHNILHRDLKPSNIILVDDDKTAKIVDFGLAKIKSEDQHLTKTGTALGSPAYMSPEAAMGMALDSRSDIFSMGCLMFETLTGQLPFKAENRLDALMKRTDIDAPSLASIENQSFPKELIELVDKCLMRDKESRFKSFDALSNAVNEIHENYQTAEELKSHTSPEEIEPSLKRTIGIVKSNKPKRFPFIEVLSFLAFIYITSFLILSFNKDTEKHSKPIHKEAETFTQIELTDIDSVIQLKSELGENGIVWKSLWGVTDIKDMKPALALKGIKYLKLLEGDLSGSAKDALIDLNLTGLNLKLSNLNDQTFAKIAMLKNLEILVLDKAHGITSSGIEKLKACKHLKQLYFRETNINDDIVAKLGDLKNLEFINMHLCEGITGNNFSELDGCTNLMSINLDYCKNLDPNNLKALAKITNLKKLKLKRCGFKNNDMNNLRGSKIKYLDIRSNILNLNDLKPLTKIKSLKRLLVSKPNSMTIADEKAFKAKMPFCKISFE